MLGRPGMKKFILPLTTAVSAAMLAATACGPDREWQISNDTRVCVDQNGNRIYEDKCSNQTSPGIWPYRWYYISRGGYVPVYNYPVSGGSYDPTAPPETYQSAPAIAPEGAITRGGFGSFGGGHGGEGGAGEGGAAGE
jgi:hypothetical protein